MALRKPIVRHFIACERVEVSPEGRQVSLVNVVYALRPLPDASYPILHPQLWLFAQMTDGQGQFPFSIDMVFMDDEETLFSLPSVTLDLGQDPLAVRGWAKQLTKILFEKPGIYEFRLLCDDEIHAREQVLLRECP
jgi:hypothetical protein